MLTRTGLRALYAEGLAAYRERRWHEARNAFKEALRVVPDDGPTLRLLGRLEGMESGPPAESWDGYWSIPK